MTEQTKKLYAVYLGGYADRCNTELHDVVFAVGHSIEETYPQLVEKWFGNPKRVHIDAWIDLSIVDGHRVTLSHQKDGNSQKLFFVNLGAYISDKFSEEHENVFLVGSDPQNVKERARRSFCQGMVKVHKDNLYDVDDLLQVDKVGEWHIHLEPTSEKVPVTMECGYHALSKV